MFITHEAGFVGLDKGKTQYAVGRVVDGSLEDFMIFKASDEPKVKKHIADLTGDFDPKKKLTNEIWEDFRKARENKEIDCIYSDNEEETEKKWRMIYERVCDYVYDISNKGCGVPPHIGIDGKTKDIYIAVNLLDSVLAQVTDTPDAKAFRDYLWVNGQFRCKDGEKTSVRTGKNINDKQETYRAVVFKDWKRR